MTVGVRAWAGRGVIVVAALAAIAAGALAWAEHRVNSPHGSAEGVLVDGNGVGLADCAVDVAGTSLVSYVPSMGHLTGPDGGFSAELRPGGYDLTTDCSGYRGRAHINVRSHRTTHVRIVASRKG